MTRCLVRNNANWTMNALELVIATVSDTKKFLRVGVSFVPATITLYLFLTNLDSIENQVRTFYLIKIIQHSYYSSTLTF